jgi:hypothetical protein
MNPDDEPEEDGANVDLDARRKGKCAVIKTSTRQVRQILLLPSYYSLDHLMLSVWDK